MKKLFALAICWSFLFLQADESAFPDKAALKKSTACIQPLAAEQSGSSEKAPEYHSYDETHQIMMGPQAIIDGCVNAITGCFFDSETDLDVPGTDLKLIRSYYSGAGTFKDFLGESKESSTDLFRGWAWNHASQLYWQPYWKYLQLTSMHSGCVEQFVVEGRSQAKIHPDVFKNWTNSASGRLGGQNDLHNQRAEFQAKGKYAQCDHWVVTLEDGTKRIFSSYPTSYGKDKLQRWVCHESERKLPNGMSLSYKHPKLFHFDRVEWQSRSLNHSIANIRKVEPTLFESSNGQSVRYHLKDYEQGYTKVPVKVERAHKPNIEYEYQQFVYATYSTDEKNGKTRYYIYNYKYVPFLSKKIFPEGRFLEIQYFDGFPKLWTENGHLCGNTRPLNRAGKVTALLAPLDGGQQAKVKYSFSYTKHHTTVKDACEGVQVFQFDDEKRLESVTSQGGKGQLLKRHYAWSRDTGEKFFCKEPQGEGSSKKKAPKKELKPGYLMRQWATDGSDKVLYCKNFEYDKQGNVVEERMMGDLTGHQLEIKVDHKGRLKGAAETCSTFYEYSQDDFHLLLREVYRNGHEMQYVYAPESNLLMASFEKVDGSIIKRKFQTYDDFGNVCLAIEDDGSSQSPDDLTGVHVRRLKHRKAFESGPQIGLIEEATDSYWDLENQQLAFLSKTTYSYYPNRLLKSQSTSIAESEQVIEKHFEYDAHSNLILERIPNGATITHRYDANDNCIFTCGPDPRVEVHKVYDTMNRLIEKKEKHADGELITRYQYDLMGKLIAETSPYGTTRKITYDSFGRPIRLELPVEFNTEGERVSSSAFETYVYDAFGRMIERKDALGYKEQYAYNCLGQVTFEHAQGKPSARHYYSLEGLKLETTLGTGSRETYGYDSLGRQTSQDRYDEKGQIVFSQTLLYEGALPCCIQDSTGREERLFYDGAGRLIEKQIREKDSQAWLSREQWRYDGLDRVTSHRQYANESDFIDQLSTYDVMGQLIEMRQLTSDGKLIAHELYDFDSSGRVVRQVKLTGGSLEEKRSEYDSHGKLITQTDALGHLWRYEYRRLQNYQQAKLDQTFEYRPDGTRKEQWQTQDELPIESKIYGSDGLLAYEAHYGYDVYKGITYRSEKTLVEGQETSDPVTTRVRLGPARKVLERIDAAGSACERITRSEYNDHGFLTTVYLLSGQILQHTCDTMGLLCRVVSSDGTIDQRLEHNAYGQLTKVSQADGTIVERSYNALGQMVFEQLQSPLGGYSVEKSYDGLGRLLKAKLPHDVEVTREYEHTFLRKVAMQGDLGSYEHSFLEYDDSGRIIKEGLVGHIGQLERTYDAMGRVNYVKTPYFESRIQAFDALGRVKSLERGFGSLRKLCYQYDALGQLLEETCDGDRTSYRHNSRQQRVAKDEEVYLNNDLSELLQVEKEDPDQMEYDFDGRLISWKKEQASYQLSYDAMNRLTRVIKDDGTSYEYLYDGLDRRIGKREIRADGQQQTQLFVYDDQFEVGSLQGDQWKEFRLIGLRTQAETGDTLLAIVEGKAYGTILDLQGSIVGWVDLSTRRLAATCEYDAFGVGSSSPLGPWGYVAKRLDPETGFVFYGKRYYVPSYGRWLTKDPKGEIDGSNLYAFIKNNPIYCWDLWGLSSANPEVGVKKPYIKNFSGQDISHFVQPIQERSAKFQEMYPEKRYNARFIMIVTDPQAPWHGESNGILTTFGAYRDRCEDFAKTHHCNIVAVYNTKLGWNVDPTIPINRNYFNQDPYRLEYQMQGKAMSLGLQFNRQLGLNKFDVCAHSNGDDIALKATNYMDVKEDAAYIGLRSLGPVGDLRKASENFKDYEGIMDEKDQIARKARLFLDSSYLKYVDRGTGGWIQNHSIDSDPYQSLHHQFYEDSYSEWRANR